MTTMTVQAFYHMLATHDWTHEMSDDQNVWRRGSAELSKIKAALKSNPQFQELFDQYQGWAWRREGFTKPEMPKSEGKLEWIANSAGNGTVGWLGRWRVAGCYWNSLRAKDDPDIFKYKGELLLPGHRNDVITRSTIEACQAVIDKKVEQWLRGAGL